jgi:hypothetical protein
VETNLRNELMEAVKGLVEAQENLNKVKIKKYMAEEEMLDEDGYPTHYALEIIKMWPWRDPKGWFDFIGSIWWQPNFGWNPHDYEDDVFKTITLRYGIATGGWSGNESIIGAMEENSMLWNLTWLESRRGGGYLFQCKEHE